MAELAHVHEKQIRDMFDAKVRWRIFQPVLRFLPADVGEDRLQDAICQTFAMFKRYALEKHVLLSDAILVHSCRQRAVDFGVSTSTVWARTRQLRDELAARIGVEMDDERRAIVREAA